MNECEQIIKEREERLYSVFKPGKAPSRNAGLYFALTVIGTLNAVAVWLLANYMGLV